MYNAFYIQKVYSPFGIGCGGEITSSTGSIVSPNYPLPYGHRAECFWTITVAMGNRIHMSFLNFGTEAGSSCNYDYLMVNMNLLFILNIYQLQGFMSDIPSSNNVTATQAYP